VLGLLIWWVVAGGVWALTRTTRRDRKRNGELTTMMKPDGSRWLLASGEDRLPIGRILLVFVLPPLLILIGYLLSSG
jgi:hypothetical protein